MYKILFRITALKSSLNVQSGTIPNLALGFTAQWLKQGNVVQIVFSNDTTQIPNGTTKLGTLPSSLIPRIGANSNCYRDWINKCSFSISKVNGDVNIFCDIATGTSSPYYVNSHLTYIV